ncbi:MAG: BamA/TamA family outer membrane protein [Cyclobacteriaceae bacterium]
MKKIFILTTLYFLIQSSGNAQNIISRYLNSLLNDTVSAEKSKLSVYPTLGFAPETSWEIGLSSVYVYKAKENPENRFSEINGFTFYTLNNQFGAFFNHALYTDHNEFFFLGEFKFKSFPLNYYGIGGNSPSKEIAIINGIDVLLKERMLKQIKPSFFTGLEIEFGSLSKVEIEDNEIETFEPIDRPLGLDGSTNLSLGWGFVYDNIHNVLNARDGIYSEWAFLHSNKIWGSDFTFTNFIFDNRIFRPVSEKNVFAVQLYSKIGSGDVPFNQLALMGGDNQMRGYYLGRFRDKTMVSSQAEFRMLPFPFSKRWGGTAFLGAATVAPKVSELSISNLKVAGGAGLRFLLFPKKDVYARLDYAFTNEGTGVYVFIGEAF